MQFSPPSRHFILLQSKMLLSTLFSNTLSLSSSLNIRDQVSHLYRTTGKFIVLYITPTTAYQIILFCILIIAVLCSRRKDKGFCTGQWQARLQFNILAASSLSSVFIWKVMGCVMLVPEINFNTGACANIRVFRSLKVENEKPLASLVVYLLMGKGSLAFVNPPPATHTHTHTHTYLGIFVMLIRRSQMNVGLSSFHLIIFLFFLCNTNPSKVQN
jgi:hypothetical protein